MLSISAMAGDSADYYLNLAREDYYLNGGEPPGIWWGTGATNLNLSGKVSPEDLHSIFKGVAPDGQRMVQNADGKGKERQPGWDLTFSAPKSVSTLWSQASETMRREIQAAQFEAVKAALSFFQEEFQLTRRGKNGSEVEQANLIVATFEHSTSRDLDPNLHTHALVMNACTRADGSYGSIRSFPFYDYKLAAGALYRAELAKQLETRLGLRCELDQRGFAFRLKGSNVDLEKLFSKRRATIQDRLKSRGSESAQAAAIAALDSRKVKGEIPPRSELFEAWRKQANQFDFRIDKLFAFGKRKSDGIEGLNKIVNEGLESITESQSHFSKRDLIKTLAVRAQTECLSARLIRAEVQKLLNDSKEIICLGHSRGEKRYTTQAVLDAEKALIRSADRLNENHAHGVKDRIISKAISRAEKPMTEEQKKAVEHLTRRGGGLRSLEGLAGTGKTTTLDVARSILEKGGYKIIGAATSGKAARELHEGAKIESVTIAKLDFMMKPSANYMLTHHAKQILRAVFGKQTFKLEPFKFDKKTVLILDEAAMIATKELAKLVAAVEKGGGMVISVFDRKQLQAIGPGGGAAFLADRHGKAELKTIVRQQNPYDVKVVEAFSAGRAEEALKMMAARGKIHIASDHDSATATLVAAWAERERGKRDKALIFVGTRADVAKINGMCQKARLRERELKGECYSKGDLTLYKGDRVLFTKTSNDMGVENGTLGTILEIQPFRRVAIVKTDSDKTINVPLKSYKSLQLGYAVTTHKGQGTTVNNSYILAGGSMQDRELSYVQASRARLNTFLFSDKHEAGENLAGLAKQMNRSNEKTLAHEIIAREQREQKTLRIKQALRI
jgi:conjugative relaxase-like TrwC/TraI family protein